MLLNSYEFLFVFLPLTLFVFFSLSKWVSSKTAIASLVIASLVYYGWWNPIYLVLILFSILSNYLIGCMLCKQYPQPDLNAIFYRKAILGIGIAFNLSLLGFFKYTHFFIENINVILSFSFHLRQLILPLAISFFTFQQIAFLVDAYKGETREYSFLHYCLFVTFFPQLIAGPIVHHKEMLSQFGNEKIYKFRYENFNLGWTLFIIGLAKKVLVADEISTFATPIFDAVNNGETLTFFEAWMGALSYTFQIYFDFSGYSDMAVGLGKMFGIRLPINFNSPYKATNIIDFWRRWHITLSRFLKDYLYIPLGGNRKGSFRRYLNLFVTMLLGGLWHGANWTFIVWGGLHGVYLIVNHLWQFVKETLWKGQGHPSRGGQKFAQCITFFAVTIAWVFFRSENIQDALGILRGMAGMNGAVLPIRYLNSFEPLVPFLSGMGIEFGAAPYIQGFLYKSFFLFSLFVIVWFFPNSYQIMPKQKTALIPKRLEGQLCKRTRTKWHPTLRIALVNSIIAVCLILSLSSKSEFLYFNF